MLFCKKNRPFPVPIDRPFEIDRLEESEISRPNPFEMYFN